MLAQFLSNLFHGGNPPAGSLDWDLAPEDTCVVNISGEEVVCSRTDGGRERISWPDLQRVEIEAADGTWGRNIFWVLHDSRKCCHVPHGSVGEMSLMATLQSLPSWDNGAIRAAMRSAGDFRYECWSRDMGWSRPRWRKESPA